MKRIIITFLFIFTLSSVSFSQDRQARHQKVMHAKENFVAKEMQLTEEEKAYFLPLYREYCAKKVSAKKAYRSNLKSVSKSSLQDAPSAETILDSEQAIIDLERGYVAKFEEKIPEDKVAKLFVAEKKFKKMLMKRVKEKRGK